MKLTYQIIISFSFFILSPSILFGQYFQPVWNTPYNPMTIYILTAELDGMDLVTGDEIGVFDIDPNTSEEICVGTGILTEPLTGGVYIEFIASMDDGILPDQANGFTPGNTMIFKLFSQAEGEITDVTVNFPYPGYDEVFTSLGSTLAELSGLTYEGQTFVPVWTSPYNPMTFYIVTALLEDMDLQPGAQIGIFDIDPNNGNEICVGAATLSSVISPDDFLEIITSMNDGTVPGQANGFTQGNSFIFKYITHDDYLIEEVNFEFPYQGYDQVFTSQGTSIVELFGIIPPTQQQELILQEGWNGISSYLIPNITDIEQLTAAIQEELVIIQNLTTSYMPDGNLNTLEYWEFTSGYQIKVNEGVSFLLSGTELQEKTISLQQGWNLMPVLSDQPVDILELFGTMIQEVIIIKEATGTGVYWPSMNISGLNELETGNTYLIKINQAFTVTFD
jgi:hypothetical protein